MEDATYRDMTEEHLGDTATADDLGAFVEACEAYQEQTDCTDAEATDYVWDGGSWHPRVNVATPAHTRHTPGPWYAAYSKTNEFPGGNIRSNHHRHGEGALLFQTGPMFHDYTPDREEELANLRLAASAPALLEALIQLMEWEGDEPGTYTDPDTQDRAIVVWQDAFDAIAKAKGDA